MVLLVFAVVIPYLALAFLIMWGRQSVPVWGRIVLGSSLLVVVIVLVVGGKAILLENQQETSDLSRRSAPVRIFAHNSSEYIQFDDPDTLINALRDVYDQTKRP